ncbi:hypothetical protein C2G38_2152797 [Gigaspora rosea]|uniref:Uncharacterized protein n=1 Tax=Gigaspora rosea TaxID=44941 RepID=A0A397WA07_9GLOM|nr:hypothetical protein C2G38_2152797 [Gigaspora rosea]
MVHLHHGAPPDHPRSPSQITRSTAHSGSHDRYDSTKFCGGNTRSRKRKSQEKESALLECFQTGKTWTTRERRNRRTNENYQRKKITIDKTDKRNHLEEISVRKTTNIPTETESLAIVEATNEPLGKDDH